MILRHLLLPDILERVDAGWLDDVRDFLARQPASDPPARLAAVRPFALLLPASPTGGLS